MTNIAWSGPLGLPVGHLRPVVLTYRVPTGVVLTCLTSLGVQESCPDVLNKSWSTDEQQTTHPFVICSSMRSFYQPHRFQSSACGVLGHAAHVDNCRGPTRCAYSAARGSVLPDCGGTNDPHNESDQVRRVPAASLFLAGLHVRF